MEQHTWPRGSGGHVFSTISASDYGETDRDRRNGYGAIIIGSGTRRRHCWIEAFEPEWQNSSSSTRDRRSDHHRPQIDSEEHACDYRLFQHEDKAQNLNVSSRKERKQAASTCNSAATHSETGRLPRVWSGTSANISKHITSLLSAPRSATASDPSLNSCTNPNPIFKNPSPTPSLAYLNTNLNPSLSFFPDSNPSPNFAMLPDDILLRIAGSFSWPNLWSASRVCRSWSQALGPLREAMLFVHWGKKFKHGRGGIARNPDKALDSFLNGAKRGCAAAMVDAGLLLWEMGRRQEGVYWYKQAAELGDPAGQCNLGLAYLQDSSDPSEAVKWFQRAALAGHVRAQYSLALCVQQGRGVECSAVKAARWYLRAAEGGSARAMYNLALCYRKGEGLNVDLREARKWMKRAALSGHRKAQFEHGLTLFAESDGGLALVFLELATRAGETAATHLRDALLQQLSPKMRTHAITCADRWQAKLNARA